MIAIVDDDHSVREALTSFVRSLGYIAMAFECAEDLLKSKRRRRVGSTGGSTEGRRRPKPPALAIAERRAE